VRDKRAWTFAVLALMLLPVFVGLVSAHHSQAGYDNTKRVELRGVVVEFKWRNPHVFIVWDGKDGNGKTVQWTGEMSSTTTMMSSGMNRESLKAGDEIIVIVSPSRSGNPNGLIRRISTADGKLTVDRLTGE
jgi:hypothetical protein